MGVVSTDNLTAKEISHIQGSYHIPVDSSHPESPWIVSLDKGSEIPTDKELDQLRSYCEFCIRKIYTEYYTESLMAMPLPQCPGHNTVIFRKGSHNIGESRDCWFYRKATWEIPPYFPSSFSKEYRELSLVELLDQIENIFPEKWQTWKRDNSAIFGLI